MDSARNCQPRNVASPPSDSNSLIEISLLSRKLFPDSNISPIHSDFSPSSDLSRVKVVAQQSKVNRQRMSLPSWVFLRIYFRMGEVLAYVGVPNT